jgi:heat shock protein 4
MKRDQFEAIISPVIFQTKQFFLQCAGQLKTMGVTISSIELIGGGSRIPLFIRTVSEVFGTEPQRTLNSSECIARGAGLYSAMNSGIFRVQGYYSVELSPETLVCSWKGDGEEI